MRLFSCATTFLFSACAFLRHACDSFCGNGALDAPSFASLFALSAAIKRCFHIALIGYAYCPFGSNSVLVPLCDFIRYAPYGCGPALAPVCHFMRHPCSPLGSFGVLDATLIRFCGCFAGLLPLSFAVPSIGLPVCLPECAGCGWRRPRKQIRCLSAARGNGSGSSGLSHGCTYCCRCCPYSAVGPQAPMVFRGGSSGSRPWS